MAHRGCRGRRRHRVAQRSVRFSRKFGPPIITSLSLIPPASSSPGTFNSHRGSILLVGFQECGIKGRVRFGVAGKGSRREECREANTFRLDLPLRSGTNRDGHDRLAPERFWSIRHREAAQVPIDYRAGISFTSTLLFEPSAIMIDLPCGSYCFRNSGS
jgi:hypothetical protein